MGALRGTNRGTELLDAKAEELITSLHLRALSEGERVLYVDAQIANGALDLRVAKQDLHSAEIPRLLIDDGRLGSAQRMGSVIPWAQSDPGHPLVNKSSILLPRDGSRSSN